MRSRNTPQNRRREGQDGIALLLVLLLVLLLSVLVAEFSYEAQVEASLSEGAENAFAAYIAAKSAVAAGLAALHADLLQSQMYPTTSQTADIPDFDAYVPGELWCNVQPLANFNGAEARCWVFDECGKLNLNALVDPDGQVNEALAEVLRVLFRNCEADEQIVDALIEYLTPATMGEPMAETEFAVKGGPMDSIEELLLVPGITPELYFDLNQPQVPEQDLFGGDVIPHFSLPDLLTVRGDPKGLVNGNTVQLPLLEAIMEAAGGSAGNAGEIIEQLRMEPAKTRQELVEILGIGTEYADALDVKSSFFCIQGDGWVDNTLVRIEARVYRNPENIMLPEQNDKSTPPGQTEKPAQKTEDKVALEREVYAGDMIRENFRVLDWRVIR